MNFVDTAITLLQESGRPMAVEELCELALERGLLDKPGANPLRSMKTRLTVELKKGSESRLRKTEDEAWDLSNGAGRPAATRKARAKAPAAAKKAKPKAPAKKSAAAETEAKKAKPTPKPKPSAKAKPAPKAKPTAKAKPAPKAKPTPKAPARAAKTAPEPVAETEKPKPKRKTSARKAEAPAAGEVRAAEALETAVVLTPEEQALVDLYSADSEGTHSVAEISEYRDELTADEDRPMLPEIRAERRPHRRDRPRERRKRRVRTERGEKTTRAKEPPAEAAIPRPERETGARDIAGEPIQVISAQGIARERLTRSALKVLSTLPAGQSMPVRQLTQTMIRQKLLEGSADKLWRMVKGTLMVSEQRRVTRGLVPIVRYHGKDLFSSGLEGGRSVVDVAASALNKAAEDYAAAVESETADRLAQLALPMLERIVYIYLQATGWTDIQWIRTVQKSSYALGTAPGAVDQTMIAVRCGPQKIDRRGVGELRAGLHAKDLSSGLLISPCELSEEADIELAGEGAHVRVLCGSELVTDLIAREVGVTWRHIQLPRIDQRFFDAVLS